MLKFVLFYIFIALVLSIKNFIHLMHCAYVQTKFIENHNNNSSVKNYEIQNSIISLLHRAKVYIQTNITAETVSNICKACVIEDYIVQAKAEYIYRSKHAIFWGYSLIKKLKIFKPIFHHTNNVFISIVCCAAESFAAYLLGLYLDTTGIGNKILAYLTALASTLIEHIL